MTIHITPEPEFSYVSFESNVPQASYKEVISRVLETFQPGKFVITVFANKASAASGSPKELERQTSFGDWLRHDIQYCRFKNYDLIYAFYSKFPSWGSAEARSSAEFLSVVARCLLGHLPAFFICHFSCRFNNITYFLHLLRNFCIGGSPIPLHGSVYNNSLLQCKNACAFQHSKSFIITASQCSLIFVEYCLKLWSLNVIKTASFLMLLCFCESIAAIRVNLVYMWWRNKISWGDKSVHSDYESYWSQQKPHLWGWQVGISGGNHHWFLGLVHLFDFHLEMAARISHLNPWAAVEGILLWSELQFKLLKLCIFFQLWHSDQYWFHVKQPWKISKVLVTVQYQLLMLALFHSVQHWF